MGTTGLHAHKSSVVSLVLHHFSHFVRLTLLPLRTFSHSSSPLLPSRMMMVVMVLVRALMVLVMLGGGAGPVTVVTVNQGIYACF